MTQIPNPFLTGSDSHHNTIPVTTTATTNPGFLLMTRPASAGVINHNRHINLSNPSSVTTNNNTFSTWDSPTGIRNNRMSSPNNHSRGWYSNHHSASREFSSFENNSQRFYPHHQSLQQSPDFRNNSTSFQQSTPARNYYGHGRSQNWSNNNSPNRKPFHNNNMQKTPLKEIPIEKFISKNVNQNPWNEFGEPVYCQNSLVNDDLESSLPETAIILTKPSSASSCVGSLDFHENSPKNNLDNLESGSNPLT